MRRADIVHLGLLLASLALAYLLPFELLLLSYAVLGPAHYFTEISWLHDRDYFLPYRSAALLLAAAAFGAMFIGHLYWSGVLLWSVFLACAIIANAPTRLSGTALLLAGAALTAAMIASHVPFSLAGTLLPTFIHVCLFTLVFMTLGALRAKSGAQAAIVGVYLLSIATILIVPPWAGSAIPALARIGKIYFGDVAPALGSLVGIPNLTFEGRITGLLSFVYTYHYLNWFLKADVIRWANIPRPRLLAIGALSAASTALYFYNYEIGILVLLFFSMLHVILEFPLNGRSIVELGARLTPATRSAS